MRLKKKRTDSIAELEAAVMPATEPTGWWSRVSSEKRGLVIHALKTTLAAAIAWFIPQMLGLHDGYWAVITVIIVLQSYVGSTVTASRDRAVGTLIGAAFGFAFSLYPVQPWNFLLALLASTLVCVFLGLKSSTRLAGVTVIIILAAQKSGPGLTFAVHRVIEVLLGIAVALAVSTLVFPDRARIRLREGLTEEFLQLGALFEAILKGYRGDADEELNDVRARADALRRANNQLMDAARNEPSGGRGVLEALGLLMQFARSLRDALAALELAVRNSHNDRFAQQLEPALGKLASDIHMGFHYVAERIHKWRFATPQSRLKLEEDIEDLENRMLEVRHTGANFSQEEILRVYAVQLHLKQLARLLRASRIETSKTLAEHGAE